MFKHLSPDKALLLDCAETVAAEFMVKLILFYKSKKCKELLPLRTVNKILKDSKKLRQAMPSFLEIEIANDEELVIVRDIHGQLFDLLDIIDLIGNTLLEGNTFSLVTLLTEDPGVKSALWSSLVGCI